MISELLNNSHKYSSDIVVGTCSLCGGAVTVPSVFWSVNAPIPTCIKCGATQKQKLPTIEMEPPLKDSKKWDLS